MHVSDMDGPLLACGECDGQGPAMSAMQETAARRIASLASHMFVPLFLPFAVFASIRLLGAQRCKTARGRDTAKSRVSMHVCLRVYICAQVCSRQQQHYGSEGGP